MLKIRHIVIAIGVLSSPIALATASVSIGIGTPHVSIGINLSSYPDFQVVPDYPVYYAPRLNANLFFYDGMYWAYQDDNWYSSSWYNGPWWYVDPYEVPLYVLRVPVRYYRQPPTFFLRWRHDAPPRWGDHWGRDWEQRRGGWDRWDRRAAPRAAPLPAYQKQYTGDRYPREWEHQHRLNQQNYRYQPVDPEVRKHYEGRSQQRAPETDSRARPDNDRRAPERAAPATPRTQPAHNQDGRRSAPVTAPPGRDKAQTQKQPPKAEPRQDEPSRELTQEEKREQEKRRKHEEEQERGRDSGNHSR